MEFHSEVEYDRVNWGFDWADYFMVIVLCRDRKKDEYGHYSTSNSYKVVMRKYDKETGAKSLGGFVENSESGKVRCFGSGWDFWQKGRWSSYIKEHEFTFGLFGVYHDYPELSYMEEELNGKDNKSIINDARYFIESKSIIDDWDKVHSKEVIKSQEESSSKEDIIESKSDISYSMIGISIYIDFAWRYNSDDIVRTIQGLEKAVEGALDFKASLECENNKYYIMFYSSEYKGKTGGTNIDNLLERLKSTIGRSIGLDYVRGIKGYNTYQNDIIFFDYSNK